MLILTRKKQESVVIGCPSVGVPALKVTILGIHGKQVKLGIEGDRNVRVVRSELLDRNTAADAVCS